MMNTMRKHTKTILWIVVVAFVSTIFFVWGMDAGTRQKFNEKQSAALVNGQPITYESFGRLWEQRFRQIFSDSQEDPSQEEITRLREELIDDMIEGVLLQQLFNKLELQAYPQEVAARIASIPAFKEKNKFSRQKYVAMLQYNRITPQEFEAEQKDAIALLKISQLLKDSMLVTDADLKDYFLNRTRKIKLAFVYFDWKNELAQVTIPEKELVNYYEDNVSQFEQPEEVKASHILIQVVPGASDEDKATAKLKLEDIRNKIVDGASFAELAKEHSDDPGSKVNGGDLGYFHKGMMVPAFEDAAFSLKPGELSEIVETNFGFHIIKVIDKKEGKKSSFQSVRKDILKDLKEEKAKTISQKNALEFAKVLKDSQSLTATAKAQSRRLQTTKWLQDGDDIKGITDDNSILDKALDLSLNQPSPALFDKENIVFLQITKEKPLSFNQTIFDLEKNELIEKLKTIRGNQARDAWIKQAKSEATIINNIAKEKEEAQSEDTSSPVKPKTNN